MSRKQFVTALTSVALIVTISGCASTPGKNSLTDEPITVVGHTDTTGMDPIATAAFWGTRYDREPNNPDVVVNFSRSLRAIDNNQEALRVINNAAERIGPNPDVMLEKGKVLIANDRAHEALRPIEQAIIAGKTEDWTAYSALGVAYDKIGEHKDAQVQYDRALSLAPGKVQILNNKGLSYALQGNHEMAERTLRTATSNPGGTARIRQNFALVLAMAGKTSEAERLARSDLPPAVADNNVAYYRNLVSAPAYWADLSGSNVDLPDFGDDPNTVSFTPYARPQIESDPQYRPRRAPVTPVEETETAPIQERPSVGAELKRPQGVQQAQSAEPASGAPMALAYDADGEEQE